MEIRKRTWEILEVANPGDRSSKVLDIFILSLIFLNVAAVIFGSVESVQVRYGDFLRYFEIVSVAIFTIEYVGRIWACVNAKGFSKPFSGRLRFALRIMSLVDLLAILPFYLPFLGVDLRFMRVLRLLRIVRVAKVGRYYHSLRLIRAVIVKRKEELVLTTAMMALLLVVSGSTMYYCENGAQPDKFPNIPATLWWAVVTLTTVGYGDIAPVTPLGKVVASFISVLGIGMFALPTGILGAGFVEEIQKKKSAPRRCPHCGKEFGQD